MKSYRIWSLDIARGVFVVTMIISHSIFFFHTNTYLVLQTFAGIADFISFTGLLLISGAAGYVAYIHAKHPRHSVVSRLGKRLVIYVIGYYLLALFAEYVRDGLSVIKVVEIFSFTRLVPFTEFIIPFLLFGFLKIPLRPLYHRLSESWRVTACTAIITYSIGFILSQLPVVAYFPLAWKAIFVGHPGMFSFPLLYYTPIYVTGIYLGRQLWIHTGHKELAKLLSSLAFTVFAATLVFTLPQLTISALPTIFNRFPPTPGFLLLGLTVSFLVLAVILKLEDLKNMPLSRTILLLLGQNSFSVLLAHTALVYLFILLEFPKVHSPILVGLLFVSSTFVAIYLAKILPLNYSFGLTFFNWCGCQVSYCTHAREHYFIVLLKRVLFGIINIPSIFSVTVSGQKYRLIKGWNVALAGVGLVLAVTPLGIAENNAFYENTVKNLTGTVNRQWIVGKQNADLRYEIFFPKELQKEENIFSFQVDNEPPHQLIQSGKQFVGTIRMENRKVGTYAITTVVKINDSEFKTRPTEFYVSEPLYVTWTIDWEGYDASNTYLQAMESIADHYKIPMTQLFNPRYYTSPDVPPERADFLTEWVKSRAQRGDEIGLHLHMFPDFVKETGVIPITDKVWGGGFSPGYDVLTTSYSYEDMVKILDHSKKVFVEKGLGEPKSYRAGAWFANSDTLKALQDTGFLVDSSGRTSYSFGTNRIRGFWDLSATTQPYFPSVFDQNSSNPPPNLTILEIPNNGADDFEYSAEEMIGRFNANYNGAVLTSPRQVTYLTHPNWFDPRRQETMKKVFEYIDQFSNARDTGPVVYTTLLDVYQNFKDRQK